MHRCVGHGHILISWVLISATYGYGAFFATASELRGTPYNHLISRSHDAANSKHRHPIGIFQGTPLREKWSHFDLKSWVTNGTKIRPGIPSNGRIFESNWLDNESQFDSMNLQLLGIPGRILFPLVTQLFRSKWFRFSFSDTHLTLPRMCSLFIPHRLQVTIRAQLNSLFHLLTSERNSKNWHKKFLYFKASWRTHVTRI